MSVQCKNCEYCSLSTKTCKLHHTGRFLVPLKVNINKQRICSPFSRRKIIPVNYEKIGKAGI